jgi:membrane associated rhomboid family serine protease
MASREKDAGGQCVSLPNDSKVSKTLRANHICPWTVTSVFAQAGVMHLAGNLLTVYYMGELVARTPGVTPIRLLVLVIGSGLAGSAFWLYQQNSKEGRQKYLSRALGFSGAVSGVGAVAAIMYPKVTAMIYGIVPMPLWALVGGYLLYDGYFLNSENTRIAHSGHLGGVAFGAVYYLLRLRGVTLPRGRKYYY